MESHKANISEAKRKGRRRLKNVYLACAYSHRLVAIMRGQKAAPAAYISTMTVFMEEVKRGPRRTLMQTNIDEQPSGDGENNRQDKQSWKAMEKIDPLLKATQTVIKTIAEMAIQLPNTPTTAYIDHVRRMGIAVREVFSQVQKEIVERTREVTVEWKDGHLESVITTQGEIKAELSKAIHLAHLAAAGSNNPSSG
ncbi:unnamed protein product [Protopolystoma xenopodis]|uniref:Uncharacterized protein n=1 Tax=Protopolystoma xenopodis TaxID=117903 RepID=A0A3S5A7F3_9PLAT|nr:unnamed protein product [Protopolystoma xenopodis]